MSEPLTQIEEGCGPNSLIEKQLQLYCRFPHSQGFAILLNGAWGSGKTSFIKYCMENLLEPEPGEIPLPPIYVSLYGVSAAAEIDDLLFQQLHPILGHKVTKMAGAVIRSLSKLTIKMDVGHVAQLAGALPEVDLQSMLSKADGRIVIFDDFERAIMQPAAILGYLNPLVEHEKSKVILIADESQIIDQGDYNRRKEKTIGQTLQFEPDAPAVLDKFFSEIDSTSARSFLEKCRNTILQIFSDSKLHNLRILKQLLWDFERIWAVLEPKYRDNIIAMEELLSLTCAAALELRSGALTEDQFHLVDPTASILSRMRGGADREVSVMDQIVLKYPSVNFQSSLVDAGTICDCVLRSRVSENVNMQLGRHSYFASAQTDVPSWRRLWLSFELEPAQQDESVTRFEKDFDGRIFDRHAVILHVIGLGLWLSRLEYPNWTNDVEGKIRKYIDDVYSRKEATQEEVSGERSRDHRMGFDGLGFKETDDPRFQILADHERRQRDSWRRRAYPSIAAQLRELAMEDSRSFLRDVCYTADGPGRFAGMGVLQHIDAEEFARAITNAPYNDQKEIAMALSIRYDQAGAIEELREELTWLEDLKSKINAEADNLPRIAREAFLNLSNHYLSGAIENMAGIERRGGRSTEA